MRLLWIDYSSRNQCKLPMERKEMRLIKPDFAEIQEISSSYLNWALIEIKEPVGLELKTVQGTL